MVDHLYLDLTCPGLGKDGYYVIITPELGEDAALIYVFEVSTLQIHEGATVRDLRLVNGKPLEAELAGLLLLPISAVLVEA